MAISFKAPEPAELRPRITVLGVGGAGGNAVNNMISTGLEGVDFIVANTDAQALAQSKAETRIQLGVKATEGLGAGAQPAVGKAGAEEALEEILEHLQGTHMVFITAGMGGGTGTGAAPVIAKAVREAGILTVGVVTKPFAFEGQRRMRIAEQGIAELQQYVHTQIVIPNQNLFRLATEETTFAQAFAMADDVLSSGVRGVTDLIVMPGMINLDFADIKSVIAEMGKAMMGTGEAEGEDRAKRAAELAISNPLLDDVSVKGAKGVLINITGGKDLTLVEVDQAAEVVKGLVDPDANIIFGNTILDDMEGKIRVSIVATGIDAESMRQPAPQLAPKTVERIRPATPRPRVTAPAAATSDEETSAEDAPNSVRNQYRFLADQMRSAVGEGRATDTPEAPVMRPTITPTLRQTPVEPAVDVPPMRPAVTEVAPARVAKPAVEPVQPARTWPETKPKRHGWFLGSRRHEKAEEPARLEPSRLDPTPMRPNLSSAMPTQTVAPAEAATVQPIRPMSEYATVSPSVRPATGKSSSEDLFQGQPTEDAFEIPSFLRKQAN